MLHTVLPNEMVVQSYMAYEDIEQRIKKKDDFLWIVMTLSVSAADSEPNQVSILHTHINPYIYVHTHNTIIYTFTYIHIY